MNISFELPTEIEQDLNVSNGEDLSQEARQAYLVELYRQERINHHQLSEALGLSRAETDGVLKDHRIPSGPVTVAELRAEVASLRDARLE
jgi:predicted HTH domain antitoxin